MPKTKKTDLQVLRAILNLPADRLTVSERRIFQAMYDEVAAGMVVGISKKQRAWADSVYDRNELDKERPAAKPVAILDKSLVQKVPVRQAPLRQGPTHKVPPTLKADPQKADSAKKADAPKPALKVVASVPASQTARYKPTSQPVPGKSNKKLPF